MQTTTTRGQWVQGLQPNRYLQRQGDSMLGALRFANLTTTQRNAISPEEGMVIYNSTEDELQYYSGGSWSAIGAGNVTSIVGITGTKAEFDTAVTDGNFLYVGDVTTNATHTGEVTGATSLTVDKTAITGKTEVTAVGTDYVLISDTSDSGNLKKAPVSDLTGSGSVAWGSVTGTLTDQTDLVTELNRGESLSIAYAVAL